MTKILDIANKKFGKLTVIEMTNTRNSCGSVYWLCECECGIRKNIDGSSLHQGRSKSCGRPECKPNFIDLSNKKFGNLTAIEVFKSKRHRGDTMWLCKCNCGNTKIVSSSSLRKNNTGSCGLMQCKPGFIDLTGRKFGILSVLSYNGKNKNGQSLWNCECLCGKKRTLSYSSLTREVGGAESCGCLRRKNQYESIKKKAYNSHKRSARRRGIATKLSYEEYTAIASELCHYCGDIDIKTNPDTGVTIQLNGIDRKNNEPYYELSNSLPCCKICNFMKTTKSYDDFVNRIRKMFVYIENILT
jgi:hypothetical protein